MGQNMDIWVQEPRVLVMCYICDEDIFGNQRYLKKKKRLSSIITNNNSWVRIWEKQVIAAFVFLHKTVETE